MKSKTAVVIGLYILLFPFQARSEGLAAYAAKDSENAEKIFKVKREISLLNLLNGLYLSRGQLDTLVSLAEKAEKIRSGYLEKFAANSAAYMRELTGLRASLYSPSGSSKEQRTRAFHSEVKYELDLMRKMNGELGRLEDEARKVLSDSQLAILAKFRPCLVPPKNLSDPVAVGQASTTDIEQIVIDVIRRMPESLYERRKDTIAESIIARGEQEKGKLPDDVRKQTADAYVKKMNDIRHMSDVDYDLTKEEIARSFVLFDDAVTYRKSRGRQLGNISVYLLSGNAAEIMKKWRDSRKDEAGGKDVGSTAVTASGDKLDQLHAKIVSGYRMLAYALVKERVQNGKLGREQAGTIVKTLSRVNGLKSDREEFKALEKIHDKLNAIAVTRLSVESVYRKVGCLAIQKRVPIFAKKKTAKAAKAVGLTDVTGLTEKIEQANKLKASGRGQQAYAMLAKVAGTLKQFKD